MSFLEMPLESFTDETLDEALSKESGLSMSLEAVDREIEKTQSRLLVIRQDFETLARLARAIGTARQERAEALASGMDHSEISERIMNLQNELQEKQINRELLEDEECGLKNVLENLQRRRMGLVSSLDSAQQDTRGIRFCVLCNAYNAKAEGISNLIEELWAAYNDLPEMYRQVERTKLPRPKDVWYNSIFTKIPVLRMNWDDKNLKKNFYSRIGDK